VNGGIMIRPSKRQKLLHPEIFEMIVDTDSDEARVSSDVSSVERGYLSVPMFSQQKQAYRETDSCH
jgi:hypothetical protein